MSEKPAFYERFPVAQRIEHLLLLLSFTTLGITGIVQKYIGADISLIFIRLFGGIESTRVIHRVAATIFFLEVIYHLFVMGYKIFVERAEMTMLPGIKDAKDGIQSFGYNFGISKTRPKMGRYSFDEKLEYWALIWGGIIMAISGFMLWNPIITAKILPGVFIPAAKAAHGGEAVLALLAILIWHFYHVHLRRWNPSMIKGNLSRHEMAEDHALELEQLESDVEKEATPPAVLKKRKSIYYPIASLISIFALVGVYLFLTAETTAISTLPPAEQAQILATSQPTAIPPALPTATKSPAMAPQAAAPDLTMWDGGYEIVFEKDCKLCHGSSGGLSLASYADALKGGNSGPGIVPGDPAASSVVTVMEAGGHPGQLAPEQLEALINWVLAGAPEN